MERSYGMPRRALHARIAETLQTQFTEIAETSARIVGASLPLRLVKSKKPPCFGVQAGQRSLDRSALVEAVEQFACALAQIETLPATPTLRGERIKLQVALITPLMHVKGYAAPETKAAVERARLLIEQAEALGEPPEDPLLLFSVLYGFLGRELRGVQRRRDSQSCSAVSGARRKARNDCPAHDRASSDGRVLGAYRGYCAGPGALRSGARALRSCRASSAGDAIWPRYPSDDLSFRSWARWLLGYPEAALADTNNALKEARGIGQAATLMFALLNASFTHMLCGDHAAANAEADELVALADEKAALLWKAIGMLIQGWLLALTGKAADAVQMITSGHHRIAVNGSNTVDAVVVITFGESLCGPWPVQRRLALHRRSDDDDRNNQGKMVRGRG